MQPACCQVFGKDRIVSGFVFNLEEQSLRIPVKPVVLRKGRKDLFLSPESQKQKEARGLVNSQFLKQKQKTEI